MFLFWALLKIHYRERLGQAWAGKRTEIKSRLYLSETKSSEFCWGNIKDVFQGSKKMSQPS